MEIIILTALGVGGATVLGAVFGFLFQSITQRLGNVVMSFAAGIMLSAAVLGLILPALDYGGLLTVIAGIIAGAVCLDLLGRVVPHLHDLIGKEHNPDKRISRVILFVAAIAIHNFPEGIAAGISFGHENIREALFIAGSIALQNIPEGMVIIAPMLAAGISPHRTFLWALATGFVEVIGTFVGCFAVSLSAALLPFGLSFAGGIMLYIVCDDMIPETHTEGGKTTYALLAGFILMLIFDVLL